VKRNDVILPDVVMWWCDDVMILVVLVFERASRCLFFVCPGRLWCFHVGAVVYVCVAVG
jgi:hypothetical protein